MPLFHTRVIEKHIKHVEYISGNHADILSAWAENLEKGIYNSETQNDSEFIQRILIDVLGYVGSSEGQSWTVAKNQPVGKGNVDVALGDFSTEKAKIIAPFELKGAKTKDLDAIIPSSKKTPVQQVWEYAMDAKGAQWVLVSNYREIRLYAVGYGRKDYETFDLFKLTETEQYARFILLLSADNFLSGKTQGFLKESEQVDKDITIQLYADYKDLRAKLIKTIGEDNPDKDPLEIIRFTQTILDRILFVAFSEDKGLLPKNSLKQAYETKNLYSPQPVWENFKGLFYAINKGNAELKIPGYNGGLFADDLELDNLNISDGLCEGFKKIGDYDFDSDVSVNILGHIFEQSISDLEELKAQAEGDEEGADNKQSKRKKDGIFYTPSYITRYIVEQAVGGWLMDRKNELGFNELPGLSVEDFDSIKFEVKGKRKGQITYNKNIKKHIEAWEAYKEVLSNIKVLDPACGSGAFLNEVFDYLKSEGELINRELAILKGTQIALFKWDTHILANNIYGVDLNNESIEITKLSLWLKTANRQEKLTYLEDNIKVGNSLIDDPNIAGNYAFDWNEEFSGIMKRGGFDVIIGNPPYLRVQGLREHFEKETACYESKFHSATGKFDIYVLFVEKAFLLINEKGKAGFILPHKFLVSDYGSGVREFLANHQAVEKFIHFGSSSIFEGATTYTALLFLSKNNHHFKFSQATPKDLTELQSFNKIDYSTLDLKPWHLGSTENTGLLKKINAIPSKSKDVFSCISQGIVSVGDSIFIMDGSISGMYFEGYSEALGETVKIEKELMKPLLKGDDVKRYMDLGSDNFVFYPHHQTGKKTAPYEEAEMKEQFPMAYKYISNFKLILTEKKVRYKTNPKYWYSLHRSRENSLFLSEKIITPEISLGCNMTFDDRGWYHNTQVYAFVKKDDCQYSYDFLLGVLNCKILWFYLCCTGSVLRGGYFRFKTKYLENFPIPEKANKSFQDNISSRVSLIRSLQKELKIISLNFFKLIQSEFDIKKSENLKETWFEVEFSEFSKALEKLIKPDKLSLSQKSEWMQHFEKEKSKALELKNRINLIDHEIDQKVYELYELTPEEIKLVEAGAN
jgi:hypothetical protein